jgi:hypothetical protein
MEPRDIAAIVSLVSTLAMLSFIVGQLRSVFATKDSQSALEKDLSGRIAKMENQSLQSHSGFITKSEQQHDLAKLEERLNRNIAIGDKLDTLIQRTTRNGNPAK